MNDDDLHAVRTLLSPRQDRPAPSWEAVAARLSRDGRRRRPDWVGRVAIPAVAAAVVLALAAGVAVALRPSGQGAVRPGATSEPSPTSTPDEVVAAFEALAGTAASITPAPLVPGQLIYVRSAGRDARTGPVLHEMWTDPEGMIALKIVVNGEDYTAPGPKSNHAAEVAEQRAWLAANGPSIMRPTPAWLDSLPTDPDALLATLREMIVAKMSRWSADHQVFDRLQSLLWETEPILPTDLRIALYRAMAQLTGPTVRSVTMGGRQLVAIRRAERNSALEILFDPATGHAAGSRTFLIGEQAAGGEKLQYEDLWSYAIVDEVDQTG